MDSLGIGARIAQDVVLPGRGDIPLLRAGVPVTPKYKRALAENGIFTVWIEDGLGEGIVPQTVITEQTRQRATAAVASALDEVRKTLDKGGALSEEALGDLAEVAHLITAEVLSLPDAALHLADMLGADQYLLQHVIDVTALGVVLARENFRRNGWIDFDGRRRHDTIVGRLSKIGLGLLLHDIGKLSMPPEILSKPGPLTPEEWVVMKRHPIVGCEMLGDDASYLIRAVVRSHHERWDGSGYPDGLAYEEIHQFARIASVADVYDAVTSERCYKGAAAPHVGVQLIEQGAGTHFDPLVVAAFDQVQQAAPAHRSAARATPADVAIRA